MLDLLFAVQHLPALDAKHFSVRLLLNCVQSVDEGGPLGRVTLDHSNSVSGLRNLWILKMSNMLLDVFNYSFSL
jgi:hypothetical protein